MKLHETVAVLMKDGKGVLSVDESASTLLQRFSTYSIEVSDEKKSAYRELLFTTPGIETVLSAVFLSEDALKGKTADGTIFSELLLSKNILVGVTFDDATYADETIFHTRLQEYKSLGVTVAKRTIGARVGESIDDTLLDTIKKLAVFAASMQREGIMPVVGIELESDGPHSALQVEDALVEKYALLIDALQKESVDLEALVIESVMAGAGSQNPLPTEPFEVAERTVRALTLSVPKEVGGILFVSSGETPETATADLNAIARLEPLHWPIAFCFSRALEEPVLEVWQGNNENFAPAQAVFYERVALNIRADAAGYSKGMESH